MLPSFTLVLLTFLAKVQQGQNQFNFGGGGGGIPPGFGSGGGAGIPPGFGSGGIGSGGGGGAGGFEDQFGDFVLSTLPKCKEASDCKKDEGCAIGTTKTGKYVNICFPCENEKKAKDQGLTVKGCGLSALTIVGIVACVILGLVLIGACITLACCFLQPNCPLYMWNQKRENGGGQGQVYYVPADQQEPNAISFSKTDEKKESLASDDTNTSESVS